MGEQNEGIVGGETSAGLRLDRHLRVNDATTSGHPLEITRSDSSFVSCEILVLELALEHIDYSFEPTMRVIGKAAVLVDVELVEHEERIVVSEFRMTYGSTNSGTFPLGLFSGEDGLSEGS